MTSIDERIVTVLKKCREAFQFYGDNHVAKDPPQPEKAERNYDAVADINALLLDMAKDVRDPDTLELAPEQELPTLPSHFARMQVQAARYIEPAPYVDFRGAEYPDGTDEEKDAFINDMIYLLDGPEQRLAQHGVDVG